MYIFSFKLTYSLYIIWPKLSNQEYITIGIDVRTISRAQEMQRPLLGG